MKRLGPLTFALALTTLSIGCMPAKGPQIRVATATAAELEAAHDKDDVWYEFQPGDVVPVRFGFLGAFEGGTDQPAVFRAKQRFFFVVSKNQPMHISFDGKTFAGPNSNQAIIAVMPREDGKGGQLGWVLYMGESGQPDQELEALLNEKKAAKKAP